MLGVYLDKQNKRKQKLKDILLALISEINKLKYKKYND